MPEELDPMDVLLNIMRDESQPPELRLEAASVLMPYFYAPMSANKPEEDDE